MKNKHLFKSVVAVVLCVVMVMSIVLGAVMLMPATKVQAASEHGDNFSFDYFKGKKISILGDSISTYAGVSNSTSYNSTIGGNTAYYGNSSHSAWATAIKPLNVTQADTWWQQTVDTLGMKLCVNNSWSGSYIRNGSDANSGCVSRCTQLHNVAGETPDIIAMFMGTNDCNNNTTLSTLGTPGDSMYNQVAKIIDDTTYAPSTILGAYSLMIARAKKAYPEAEIYCFTLLHKIYDGDDANRQVYEAFHAGLKTIAAHYGVYVVDLYNDCGLHETSLYKEYCLSINPINSLHPKPAGMDAITNCLISTMMKNSKYVPDSVEVYDVSYDLANTYVKVGNVKNGKAMYGDVTAAIGGKPFQVELDTAGIANIDITVTMGGVDITADAVHGDVITIDNVTGDIVITATEFDNFYWYAAETDYVSNPNHEAIYSFNDAIMLSGTYGANGDFATGTGVQFKLNEPAILLHDRPWVFEFNATGLGTSGFQGGILLTSDTPASDINGNAYFHMNTQQFLIGHRDSGHKNSGYGWDQIAEKVGSSSGDAFRNENHTYRLVNIVNADGSNMIYLYVDGKEVGAMDEGEANLSRLAGRDYVINYLGSSNYPLQSCNIHYIKIFENGEPTSTKPVQNFRWDGIGTSMTSVATDGYYTENVADIEKGTGINGVHPNPSYYSLDKPITLLHDRSWTIEWKAKGSWGAGSGEDPMLFATTTQQGAYNGCFLWRNSYDQILIGRHLGANAAGASLGYDNYGLSLEGYGLSDTVMYIYRLENVVSYNTDGSYVSNMVYLYVDDVLIGAMDDHFQNGNAVSGDTENTWISGKDFVFSYIGTPLFPLSDVTFDYIQVWENGYRVDTSRLEYLVTNSLDSHSSYDYNSWVAYNNAIKDAKSLLVDTGINQELVDAAVERIISTRNQVVAKYSGETKIYSVELVTGTYARVGKQTGLKVITSPDVAQVCVENQKLIVNSSEIQQLNGETVKVWLVSFLRTETSETTITYGVGAWTTYDASHKGTSDSNPDAHQSIKISYKSKYVVGLTLAAMPTQTVYYTGDTFNTAGMVIKAEMSDGTIVELTSSEYFIQNPTLGANDTVVTINYDGATVDVPVTVYTSVMQAHWGKCEGTINLVGYYAGIADEGLNSDKEILLKDKDSYEVIAVRCDDFDTVKDQFSIGTYLVVRGTVEKDTSDNTPNKLYFAAESFAAIDSPGFVSYDLSNARQIVNWEGMTAQFQIGEVSEYTIFKFTGTIYLHYYEGEDTGNYRLHLNADATMASQIKPDGTRAVCLRGNVMEHNLGNDWLNLFGGKSTTMYPGIKVQGTIYAMYTGANSSYFQLTILDADWVNVTVVE